ncbi:MAG: dTDP-4-dehydrorhamnose 3,5-epimerase [Okeania sp. SIO3B5]|nr:dTDP-4-dehydrorhamnose 3,5-epimerase [Okeania sp. SIO3B5]
MKLIETKLTGCYIIQPRVFQDERGSFVKTFHQETFEKYKLETKYVEEVYSISHQNVLRGLHFQIPPHDHTKLVYCLFGRVIDAVVDLRVGSPTYGQYETFELSQENAHILYIPTGFAHGFYTTSEKAILVYNLTSVYAPNHDRGVRWDSVGISWPLGETNPIISERDRAFLPFSEFESPFVYE